MENETGKSLLPAALSGLAPALAQSIATAGKSGSTDPYMKFTKFGEWMYGTENVEVQEGSQWVVNPLGFVHGFTAWGTKEHGTDGQNVGEMMVPATQPMPNEGELPSVKGAWAKCVGMQLRCLTGEDEGVQVLFKTNSTGGRKAYAALLQSVVQRLAKDPGTPVPVITLAADSYEHKSYGKIFTPELTIVKWLALDDTAPTPAPAIEAPAEDAPTTEEPRRRRRRAV